MRCYVGDSHSHSQRKVVSCDVVVKKKLNCGGGCRCCCSSAKSKNHVQCQHKTTPHKQEMRNPLSMVVQNK